MSFSPIQLLELLALAVGLLGPLFGFLLRTRRLRPFRFPSRLVTIALDIVVVGLLLLSFWLVDKAVALFADPSSPTTSLFLKTVEYTTGLFLLVVVLTILAKQMFYLFQSVKKS